MKRINKIVWNLSAAVLIAGLTLSFNACTQNSPMSADEGLGSSDKELKILRLKSSDMTLHKRKNDRKLVTRGAGGNLAVQHGSSNGSATNLLYGNDLNAPYNVYKIDPENPGNTSVVGQLGFSSAAIAMNPMDGLVYYVGNTAVNGVYPVGVWDPETNTNVTLPNGSAFQPSPKLAFSPDGTLYGVNKDNSSQIHVIDTETGTWSLVSTISGVLGAGGDIAFDSDGTMFSLRISGIGLQTVDLSAGVTNTVGPNISFKGRSGLAFVNNGQLYLSRKNGDIYALDKATGIPTFKGNIGMSPLNDLAPVIAASELAFADVTLNILPETISEDAEVSLEIETTELSGGVAITFEPHGVSFSSPAILNIEAHGVDFTGVDPESVDVYYDNPDTGEWEPMQRDDVLVNAGLGTVKVINAKLPHFSRYAIGGGP
jgi:outer membrane protein assembly factor BamB